jgi:hypothetical protein
MITKIHKSWNYFEIKILSVRFVKSYGFTFRVCFFKPMNCKGVTRQKLYSEYFILFYFVSVSEWLQKYINPETILKLNIVCEVCKIIWVYTFRVCFFKPANCKGVTRQKLYSEYFILFYFVSVLEWLQKYINHETILKSKYCLWGL